MKHIKKSYIYALLVFLLFLLLFSVIFSIINVSNNKIIKGILINNIDISNLTKDEAKTKIKDIISTKLSNNISFVYNEETISTSSFENFDIQYKIDEAVNNAYSIGRSTNIFKSNYEILGLIFNTKNITIDISINNEKFTSFVNDLSSNLSDVLIQSDYYIDGNNLILTPGKSGNIIEYDSLKKALINSLQDLLSAQNSVIIKTKLEQPNALDIDKIYSEIYKEASDAYYEENTKKIHSEIIGISFDKEFAKKTLETPQNEYIIPLQYTYPETTIKDLNIDIFQDTLSIFTTKYNITNTDRTNNLELAAEKIDGKIIYPDEVFSYNKTVGARTIEKGYTEAKIFSNGQVVDGIGGGICQVSSTLYDAAVMANLEIMERHNHQFLTSYLPAGKDATVSYGAKDLKFKNSRSYPIKIDMKVENGIVTCKILGIKEDTEYAINIETETLSTTEPEVQYEQDSSIEVGTEKVKQNGATGTIVNVYKIIKQDGKIISKDLLSQDTYKVLNKIILKNDYLE